MEVVRKISTFLCDVKEESDAGKMIRESDLNFSKVNQCYTSDFIKFEEMRDEGDCCVFQCLDNKITKLLKPSSECFDLNKDLTDKTSLICSLSSPEHQ
jgi:hypothetical protein